MPMFVRYHIVTAVVPCTLIAKTKSMNGLSIYRCYRFFNLVLSPIRMRQINTHVNLLRCVNVTRGKQIAHANENTHRSKLTH